jgi:hypothetical protein
MEGTKFSFQWYPIVIYSLFETWISTTETMIYQIIFLYHDFFEL